MTPTLAQEERRLTNLLTGKTVKIAKRNREAEVLLEFTDGTRLFVDCAQGKLELSVTGGSD